MEKIVRDALLEALRKHDYGFVYLDIIYEGTPYEIQEVTFDGSFDLLEVTRAVIKAIEHHNSLSDIRG